MNTEDKGELKAIVLLLLVTVALVLLQKYGLNRTLIIDAASDYPIYPIYDQMSGGESIATLTREGDKLILDCDLRAAYAWPYCEFSVDLRQTDKQGNVKGVDLSRFDRVGLWAGYENNAESGLRLQLRNYNPAYSTDDNPNSLKYNVLEFDGVTPENPLWISLDNFQVATWWLVESRIPFPHMAAELTNVTLLELVTGSGLPPGNYRLVVERIEFQGKIISLEELYLIITSLWVATALFYVAYWLICFRAELTNHRSRHQELEAINRVLNIKSQQLEDKVRRDPLTGALNRAGLQKLFFDNLALTHTNNRLCIVFMDIDYFKNINDTHGHNFGDKILKEFVALIAEKTRTTDVLARWGGEEFILACPESTLEEASTLAEKLRLQIVQHSWPGDLDLTCSFGVAQMADESIESFIHRADGALYKAKAQGRNKVVVSRST